MLLREFVRGAVQRCGPLANLGEAAGVRLLECVDPARPTQALGAVPERAFQLRRLQANGKVALNEGLSKERETNRAGSPELVPRLTLTSHGIAGAAMAKPLPLPLGALPGPKFIPSGSGIPTPEGKKIGSGDGAQLGGPQGAIFRQCASSPGLSDGSSMSLRNRTSRTGTCPCLRSLWNSLCRPWPLCPPKPSASRPQIHPPHCRRGAVCRGAFVGKTSPTRTQIPPRGSRRAPRVRRPRVAGERISTAMSP